MSSSILHTVVSLLHVLSTSETLGTTPIPTLGTTPVPTPGPTLSPTGAFLAFPSVIDGPLYGEVYDVSPAHFGYHRYGGQLEGVLILPANESYHKECPKTDTEPEGPEPIGLNPYIHYIRDWFVSAEEITEYILLIDRLDCYFVDKIEQAQLLGASGVVICDWKAEHLFTMWMPRDWSDDITIPSVLLQNENCRTLMDHIGVQNWDPNTPESMVYPTPEQMNWTIATIEWSVMIPNDTVKYQLWTSSNDFLGATFKHNFNTTAIELDRAGGTTFAPHMYILDGTHWSCDDIEDDVYPCQKQCTNSGRYCSVDPEYDLSVGVTGLDVVQENLRSLCVWEWDKATYGTDDIIWWDYAVLWDENCGIYANSTADFNANCSFAQMDVLDTTETLKLYVQNCIVSSGGYEIDGGVNTILRREMKLKSNSSIHSIPMIAVNDYLMNGNIDCPTPVTHVTCQVLAAICSGFTENTEPWVCDLTPAPTIAVCNNTEQDCSGLCWGHHELDACGNCLLLSDPTWDECIGCNGQINETYDCVGTCGGHYTVNPCGYCKDTRIHGWETYGVDCNGTCSMELREDECGQCILESDPNWNTCMGCDNRPNSDFEFNPCGRCIDSSRADYNTFGEDCSGTCDGYKETDLCNTCLETSSLDWNKCVGCDGVPDSGKAFNECGRCLDSTDPEFDDYGKDCRGTCASSEAETYYTDECGQCLLRSDAEFDNCCGGDPDKNFNECGLCLEKDLADFNDRGKDCNGTCSGLYVLDACGECLLTTDPTFDECIKCGEDSDMQLDCMDVCGGNFATNPCGRCINSNQTDFETYGQDCADDCEGSASFDQCGNCLEQSSTEWNSCVGCDGVVDSNMALNPCGICILSTTSDFETSGTDCAGECDGSRETDECGNCLLSTDTTWNDCVGCDNVANSYMEYNDCGVCIAAIDEQFNEYGRDCTGNCARTASSQHYVDECGNCLLSTDTTWNACLATEGDTSSTGESGNTSSIFGNTTVIIIAASAFVGVACALLIVVYLCRKHREMKMAFDEIQRTYRPMDDMPQSTTQRHSKIRVPDQEAE